jgi:hypothetical protein
MIPALGMTDTRRQAEDLLQKGEPIIRAGALLVVGLWLAVLALVFWLIVSVVTKRGVSNPQ